MIAVLLAAVLFGTTGTAQARGPDATTPLGVGWLRIVVGAVALTAIAWWTSRAHRTRDGNGAVASARWTDASSLRWVVVGAVGVAGYQPAFFTGTERSGVALGTIVALGSGPVFAGALDAVLFRRRPPAFWAGATAVAVAGGVVLVAAQGGEASVDAVGIVCSLGAGASYAVYAVAGKVLIDRGVGSTTAMAAVFVGGAVLLAPFAVGEPYGWLDSTRGVVMLTHLGIVTVGIAYALYGYGLRTLATSTAVTLTLAEPVTAALAGVVVLGERLPPLGWFGAALVVTGLALTGRRPVASRRDGGPAG